MNKPQKHSSPLLIWCYGLVLILVWLSLSSDFRHQHLHRELASYSEKLGTDTGKWIIEHGQQLYQKAVIDTGVQTLLIQHTTPDGQMGDGLARVIRFFQTGVKNLMTLILQLCVRIALLVVCLPFWGLILLAAIADGFLIRRIRYHDFHYTSPLQNLWGRRLSRWVPGLFLYLIIVPLSFPVWLIPTMALATAVCLGWWTANWQKQL